MALKAKEIPKYKPYGKEWESAMHELNKGALISILKAVGEEV